MTRFLIFIGIFILLANCKRGNHQVVSLRNLSSENIYFLLSSSEALTDPNEVARVRPITPDPFSETREQAAIIKHNLYRYRIESDSIATVLSSESAEIFVNAISVQSIIKSRYDGQVNIFIIAENDLIKHSDQEIISKNLFKHFRTLTGEEIKADTIIMEYF